MASLDFDNMTLDELKKLDSDISKAIASFEQRKKNEALAAVEAKAREMGYSLAELSGGANGKTVSVPKYQNLDDPTRTWTGRGRKPAWFKEALDAGKTPDDMLIA